MGLDQTVSLTFLANLIDLGTDLGRNVTILTSTSASKMSSGTSRRAKSHPSDLRNPPGEPQECQPIEKPTVLLRFSIPLAPPSDVPGGRLIPISPPRHYLLHVSLTYVPVSTGARKGQTPIPPHTPDPRGRRISRPAASAADPEKETPQICRERQNCVGSVHFMTSGSLWSS